MTFFLFGKKKKRSVRKKITKKPPVALLRKCKKLKIKCTMRKSGRRVYKSVRVLKKLVSKKMKKMKKKVHRRRKVRFGFGFGSASPRRVSRFGAAGDFSNTGPSNYGYNQEVVQKPGILNQSSQIVTSSTNDSRPTGMGLPGEYVPTYGVYRPFFGEQVPTQVPPNWDFMGQPDGTMFAVGGPFAGFKAPASFGRRRGRGRGRSRVYFGKDGCGARPMVDPTAPVAFGRRRRN